MSSNYVVCGSDELVYGPYGDHASAFAQVQSLAKAMASQSPNTSVQENVDSCVVIKTVEKQRNIDGIIYNSSYQCECASWSVRQCQE